MQREERIEVLVVGAGPVGMLTALLLSEAGVQVRIIDQDCRTTSRTYACALHSRTLQLLDQLGIARDVLAAGRLVDRVAFYSGATRRAEAKLSELTADFPFVVVTPQSIFEQLLEERLRKDGTVQVNWNHRLSRLQPEASSALAVVDQLGVSAKGYIVPEMEWSVKKTENVRAAYVVGADGPNSLVAHALAAGSDTVGHSEFYAVYEFLSDWQSEDELRIVLDDDTTSVLWPLPGNRFRWSFELREEHLRDFPSKERKLLTIGDPGTDQANRDFMHRLIQKRAPWFDADIEEVVWSADVEFEHRLGKSFGRGPCWLAGDAAHQTGPAAMQSMNMGLLEGERLAIALTKILRENGNPELLSEYDRSAREGWSRLLGLTGSLQSSPKADPWVREKRARILPCLPASGKDLASVLSQLHLHWT